MTNNIYSIPRKLLHRLLHLGLVILTALTPYTQAAALGFSEPPPLTNREKAHRNIIFTGVGDGSPSTCDDSESSVPLTGSENLERIFNYFRAKGVSPEQAAGIIGNISVESGGDPENTQSGYTPDRTKDPTEVSKNSEGKQGGWGIIQWTPSEKIIGLLRGANITSPVYELSTQLELVWWHMNNTSPTGVHNMYANYQNITDVAEATRVYEDQMEGASIPHIEERIKRARAALRQYGGGSTTTSPVSSSPTGCGSEGGIASANGFTFPLITTQKAITDHKPYPWCYAKLTNCHHDYKAADLMIGTGTTVIAAKSGRVQNVNAGSQHPNNVTINTDDGQGINYYTHMGANTAAVRVGQHVEAGDTLGKVGTSVDAMNTDPHLHFDMLPPGYRYRPSCSGAACSNYPFIEVQPALIETFKRLPEG